MSSFLSKFEYQKNQNGEPVAAIYPLTEITNKDALLREHLGGSTVHLSEPTTGSRFDGLGVPVGLYLSRKRLDMVKKNPEIQEGCTVIDEDKFNQLLDKIVKKSQKRLSKKNKKSMGSPIGTNKTSKKR
jgi:hypothetical protein